MTLQDLIESGVDPSKLDSVHIGGNTFLIRKCGQDSCPGLKKGCQLCYSKYKDSSTPLEVNPE